MDSNVKRVILDYKDTDESIEIDIYGLIFKIRELDKEELERIDRSNENELEKEIDKILGEGAVDKINEKRVKDGYKKIDTIVGSNILGAIMETYVNGTVGKVVGKTSKAINETANDLSDLMNMNREQRRNYNRNYYNRNNRNCKTYNRRYY